MEPRDKATTLGGKLILPVCIAWMSCGPAGLRAMCAGEHVLLIVGPSVRYLKSSWIQLMHGGGAAGCSVVCGAM